MVAVCRYSYICVDKSGWTWNNREVLRVHSVSAVLSRVRRSSHIVIHESDVKRTQL